jgi:sodium transport system permease protein
MRWNIVGLIFRREMLDQLRDRRTLFMIVVLPLLLYPISGLGLMQFTTLNASRASKVGLVGAASLPAAAPNHDPKAFPPLLADKNPIDYGSEGKPDVSFTVQPIDSQQEARAQLDDRKVDLLLLVEADFLGKLERNQPPQLEVVARSGDERSRTASTRLTLLLRYYREKIKRTHLARSGLPPDFGTFTIKEPDRTGTAPAASDPLFRMLIQIFPLVLVMWSLAGALYPAVDLCAGEKERGTMETLLISPASREEIVWGKFLTIWVFSGVTAFLNMLSIGLTVWYFGMQLMQNAFQPSIQLWAATLLWGTILLLPLSAFFSAISLAIGVYARSSKEGQYYLMPLFLITMPLIFLTLAPGVELNSFYSMVPVTGVALLLQSMLKDSANAVGTLATFFVPVLLPMVIYSWLALRWAIEQFQREEVLFREAEQLDLRLWVRNLFRDKEPLPSAGMAFFCFGVVVVLLLLGKTLPITLPLLIHVTILYIAAVATPPLMMAVLLTTRPLLGLSLRPCTFGDLVLAVVLAALLFLPGVVTAQFFLDKLPALRDRVIEVLSQQQARGTLAPALLVPLTALLLTLVSVCEELVFRGFVLTGLSRRYGPGTALFLSSFLFALFQLNVYQAIPHFVLGLVLGILTQRTGSLYPAIVFHAVYNILIGLVPFVAPEVFAWCFTTDPNVTNARPITLAGWLSAAGCLAVTFALLPGLLRRPVRVPPEVLTPERVVPVSQPL